MTTRNPIQELSYESEIAFCDTAFKGLLRTINKQKDYLVDTQMLQNAYDIAKMQHGNKRRHSKQLYLRHPLAVLETLVKLKCQSNVLIAGLLHDTMEDCDYQYDEIRETFNPEVAEIVEAVTAIKQVEKSAEEQFDTLTDIEKHDFLDMLTDQKLINAKYQRESFLVRLADREHNLMTLDACTPDKRRKKIEQTQAFLIPAARQFGMRYFEVTLNDYCMKYADYSPDVDSFIPPIHRRRNELMAVSGDAYGAFDHHLLTAIEQQSSPFFAFPRFNPLARPKGGKFGEEPTVERRRRMRPYEIAVQLEPDIPLDQAKWLTFERQDVCLSEVILMCESSNLKEILSKFVAFHREHLAPNGITFELESTSDDCVYLILTDNLENNYHLVLVPAAKLFSYFVGIETVKIPTGPVSDIMRRQITVYAYSSYKPLREIQVPEGSTALDLAFLLQPKLGLSVKFARIKKYTPGRTVSFSATDSPFALNTILNENDVVNFEADYEEKIGSTRINAQMEWFRYVKTEYAVEQLIGFFLQKFE